MTAPRRSAADVDWLDQAVCKGRTRLFFAPPGEGTVMKRLREDAARKVCQTCPVMLTCRQHARDHQEYGFWGGESEDERALNGYLSWQAFTGTKRRKMKKILQGAES